MLLNKVLFSEKLPCVFNLLLFPYFHFISFTTKSKHELELGSCNFIRKIKSKTNWWNHTNSDWIDAHFSLQQAVIFGGGWNYLIELF